MKSRMTLRMGKMLEARTAPGNQWKTGEGKNWGEGGQWRMGCDLVYTQREDSQKGKKESGGNGRDEHKSEGATNKDRKAY